MKDNSKISHRNNWIHGGTTYCLENSGEGANLFEYNQKLATNVKETEQLADILIKNESEDQFIKLNTLYEITGNIVDTFRVKQLKPLFKKNCFQ